MTHTRTRRARTPTESYLTEINTTPLLIPAEERDLARRVQDGDASARDHLVRANLRLVVSLARRYAQRGLPLEDLVAEGNVGLLRAAEGFDPEAGTRFATYAAYWIKQSVRRAVQKDGHTVRLPQYMWTLVGRWHQAAAAMGRELGRPAEDGEVAARLGLPPRKARAVRKALRVLASAQAAGGDGRPDPAAVEGRAAGPLEELAGAEEVRGAVAALGGLTEREAAILRLRYGLGGESPATLKEVGARLGYTRERVRQIERDALTKLRDRLAA